MRSQTMPRSLNCYSSSAMVSLCDKSNNFESERCIWSDVAEETNELVDLHENTRTARSAINTNSQVKRTRKDGKYKGKKKVSFLFWSKNRDLPSFSATEENKGQCEDIEMLVGTDLQNMTEQEARENFVVYQSEKTKCNGIHISEEAVHGRESGHSVSSLLGDLEKSSGVWNETSRKLLLNRTRDRKSGLTGKRKVLMGNRFVENDDQLDFLENEVSSDEDADKFLPGLVTGENRDQSTVNLFHVFTDTAIIPNQVPLHQTICRSNYNVRLQQLLQKEKDIQIEFLKLMQVHSVQNEEPNCFYVQILSRSFDARLIVCECQTYRSFKELDQTLEKNIDEIIAEKKTIIFRSKICKDVDLGAGNFICIHRPWIEVHVGDDEEVLLCMYFSQVMP